MVATGTRPKSASSGGIPGAETSGCSKPEAPAWRARSAGTELRWWVSTSVPFEKPAARLSPTDT